MNCFIFHFRPVANVGVYRDQVVLAVRLHAVAGVVKQPNAALPQLSAKLTYLVVHGLLGKVFTADDLEAHLLQRFGHVPRIVDRVAQWWRYRIVRVADDQSNPTPRRLDSHSALLLLSIIIRRERWQRIYSYKREQTAYAYGYHFDLVHTRFSYSQ